MEVHSAGVLYAISKIYSYFMSIYHSKLHNHAINIIQTFFMFCICELDFAVISNSAGMENGTRQHKNRILFHVMLFKFKASQNTL